MTISKSVIKTRIDKLSHSDSREQQHSVQPRSIRRCSWPLRGQRASEQMPGASTQVHFGCSEWNG